MKRKKFRPKGQTKFIRINDKTLIEVDVNMPEDIAKSNYLKKVELSKPVAKRRGLRDEDYFIKDY